MAYFVAMLSIHRCLVSAVHIGTAALLMALVVPAQDSSTTPKPQNSKTPTAQRKSKSHPTVFPGQEVAEHMTKGEALVTQHNLSSAELEYRKAVELSNGFSGDLLFLRATALSKLAEVLDAEKKSSEAETLLKERVGLLEGLSDPLETGRALFDLQSHYGGLQEIDLALETTNRAVALYESCISAGRSNSKRCDRQLADVQGMMGSILFIAKRHDEAEPWFRSVVARDDDAVRPEIMLISLQASSKLLFERGEVLNSVKMAHRAEEFRYTHPDAARAAGEEP